MTMKDRENSTKAILKKVLIGIVSVVVVVAFASWQTMVMIHDRTASSDTHGSLNTFLELFARFADTGKRASAAYDKGDFTKARSLYQKMAEHGNSDVMLRLAVMDTRGQGGPVDNIQAVKWFRLLADRGDRAAQFAMGLAYGEGRGVAKDYPAALGWYLKSAKQGQ